MQAPHLRKPDPLGSSFLPEDYLQQRADRRAGLITLVLFAVVMLGVVGAFFVTNRQRSQIEAIQDQIAHDYATEAKKIEQLKVLELQKSEMLEKAEITTALLERVPRSILMAELINRMPQDLTLTEFTLASTRVKEVVKDETQAKAKGARSIANKSQTKSGSGSKSSGAKGSSQTAAKDKETEGAPPAKPTPPKFTYRMQIVGLSLDDSDVADYQAALKACPLLANVDLIYSGEELIDDVALRKFSIEADLRLTADARRMEPLQVPRFNTRPDLAATPGAAPPVSAWLSGFKGMLNGTNPQPTEDGLTNAEKEP